MESIGYIERKLDIFKQIVLFEKFDNAVSNARKHAGAEHICHLVWQARLNHIL